MAGKRMACGCRVDIIPTTLGILDPVKVLCVVHGWQPIPGKEAKKGEVHKGSGQRTLDDCEEEAEADRFPF